jgi:hypothetical protein
MRVFSTLLPRSTNNENKSCMRVYVSWEAKVCMRVFSTLMPRSTNENKSCMRVDESWLDINARVAKTLIKISTSSKLMRVDKSAWESMRVGAQTPARVATLINSHPLSEALVSNHFILYRPLYNIFALCHRFWCTTNFWMMYKVAKGDVYLF